MKKVKAEYENGKVLVSEPIEKVRNDVLEGKVTILEGVFDPERLRNLKEKVFKWGQENPQIEDSTQKKNSTFHSIDVNPEESDHPKIYHSFNFIFPGEKEESIDSVAYPYFSAIREFQNRVAETDGKFGMLEGLAMRPTVIHYPRGGGGFPLHTHPFLPQKIGLIVNLSEEGVDYEHGGTRFALPSGDVVDTKGEHTIGDIVLFRIDLPHNVYPCDPEHNVNFDSIRGRWSMILPYNRY